MDERCAAMLGRGGYAHELLLKLVSDIFLGCSATGVLEAGHFYFMSLTCLPREERLPYGSPSV